MAELFSLKVKMLDGKVVELKIPTQCTIPALKVYITEQLGTPASEQKLIFQGKVLRDDKTVAEYSLKEGSTIHMVKKQPEQPANATSSTSTPQNQQANTPNPDPRSTFGSHNIVMGTISLPENSGSPPPNLNQIIGNVLGSFGVQNPLGSSPSQNNSPNQPPVDAFSQLRQNFDILETNISQVQSISNSVDIPNLTSTSSTNNNQVEMIGQFLGRVNQSFNHIAPHLSNLAPLLQSESNLTNSLSRQETQRLANQLGPIFHQLGHVILSLGTSLQSVRMNDTPNSGRVAPPQRPIIASATVAAANVSADPRGMPTQMSQLRVPLFSVASTNGSPTPMNLSSILSGVANTLNQTNTNNVQSMMSQFMGIPNPSTSPQSTPSTPSTVPSSTPMSNVVNSMSQTIPFNSIPSQGINEDPIISSIFQKILEKLSISDIASIFNGQLEPLQTIHPLLQSYLKELLKGNESSQNFEHLADEIVNSFKDNLNENNMPQDLKQNIIPGYEISLIARHTIRKYALNILKIVHANYQTSTTDSTPFARAVKESTAKFTEEIVFQISQAMKGGMNDATRIIKFFLQSQLNYLGPEMRDNITALIMNHISMFSENTINLKDPSNWKKVMDIDEIRQTYAHPQQPFSDSYVSGIPAKRRKLAPTVSVDKTLEETLRDTFKNANLPIPNESIISNAKTELCQAFKVKLSHDLKQRLTNDKDFENNETKFPNSSKAFKN